MEFVSSGDIEMKYSIEESYHGYVRGTRTIIVEAKSEEEALKRKSYGEIIYEEHDRDDTDSEVQSIERVDDGNGQGYGNCDCSQKGCCQCDPW